MPEPKSYCALAAQDAGHPLAGTAAESTWHWILLEHPMPWPARIMDSSRLSAQAKAHLSRYLSAHPEARLQFVCRASHAHNTHKLFIGRSKGLTPTLFETTLCPERPLESIDLDGPHTQEHSERAMAHWRRVDLPMVLVCTHGRRDRCCARYGFPVFRHLHESLPQDMIWQTSHIGGHRFAATLLLFPHAYCYGQLSAETALDVVQAWSEGQLAHGHLLRGRTCYPRWAQAAEIAWRNRHQVTAVSAVEHVDGVSQHAPHASAPVDTSWTASLKTSSGTASVQVERVPLETAVPPSCGKAPEHTTAWTVVTPGRSPIGAR